MKLLFALLLMPSAVLAQTQDYGEYEAYQTFSDLDKYQRDYGLMLVPGGIYYSIQEDNEITGATANDRRRDISFYDIKLSYVFNKGFYFGLIYTGEEQNINQGGPKSNRTSLGFSLGYMRYGWMFIGSWLAHSAQELSGAADVSEYDKGSGFQVDLAYHFRLTRFISIGPQLSYKSINYSESENATTSQDSDASSTHTVLTPMISFIINLYRG